MLYSGDQLHATIPNTSKLIWYSIDLRRVDRADVGGPRVDAACQGTSLRDFHRLTDEEALPEDEIALDDTADAEGLKVFVPN